MTITHRIFVTGAGGFVGGWLRSALISALPHAEILAIGHETPDLVSLDVTKAEDVDDLVREFRPTAVVHLAAISSPVKARAEIVKSWEVNLFGTMYLAQSVMRHAPQARFIYASSSEVYGKEFNQAVGPLEESAGLTPINPYATSKAAADLMLGEMAEAGLQAVRFRPFNHTGPGQSTQFSVPAFVAQIVAAERGEREPVLHVGNLEARRDFLDVRDVVAAYLLALTAPSLPAGVVMNLASGVPRRIGDILDDLVCMSRVPLRIESDSSLMRPSEVPLTFGSAARAQALLGWRPHIPWDQTLRDVIDHVRSRRT